MTSRIEIVLVTVVLLRGALAVNYNSTILTQRIVHYDNPHVGFDVKFYGDQGYPYLLLNEEITPYNDLHLMLYAKVYDGIPNLLTHAPLSLCQLLHEEAYSKNFNISQFNIPQIFNLVGKTCPIEQGRIRLSPYLFPSRFNSETDFGCGYHNVEARLMKCSEPLEEGQNRVCETLVKTVTLALLANDNCKDKDFSREDGWNIQKVDQ